MDQYSNQRRGGVCYRIDPGPVRSHILRAALSLSSRSEGIFRGTNSPSHTLDNEWDQVLFHFVRCTRSGQTNRTRSADALQVLRSAAGHDGLKSWSDAGGRRERVEPPPESVQAHLRFPRAPPEFRSARSANRLAPALDVLSPKIRPLKSLAQIPGEPGKRMGILTRFLHVRWVAFTRNLPPFRSH